MLAATSARQVVILYGSETGNCEDLALCLATKLRYHKLDVVKSSLDDFDLRKLLDIKYLVVICSTTGQGEIPRNGRNFWKFMRKRRLPGDLFSNLVFTSFGLGDSSYPKYNSAIRKVHARFLQLGAKELCPRGEGDEQSLEGTDAYYSAWESQFLTSLNSAIHQIFPVQSIPENDLLPPINSIIFHTNQAITRSEDFKKEALNRLLSDKTQNPPKTFELVENKILTTRDHFQEVRMVSFTDPTASLDYSPGDILALYPVNDPKDVDLLIELQKWSNIADYPISFQKPIDHHGSGIVRNLTLRTLLLHHLDIMSIPRRSFFSLAWHFADDTMEKDKLREFSRLEESEQLYDYANRPRRSILEVIQEFSSLKIPVDYLTELIPTLKPRLFSISSRPDTQKVDITVAIVEYRTVIRRLRKGVCTKWIKQLVPGDLIIGSIIENHLNFEIESDTPIIAIATGSGIAPVKSMIEYVLSRSSQKEIYLFAGHRFMDRDYLYGDLWESLCQKHPQFHIFPSFSRQGSGYVQESIYKQKVLVNRLVVSNNGLIFLCGSSGRMPTQVRLTLETIFAQENSWTEQQSKEYLEKLENNRKYIQETW
ncbi:hypothetical protein OGAPHI_000167 [Ogataea philodendri]|uniref:NADPH-dependent diflavin oxidoreductase 1 n=1 Tax=Ogataea philodendri TaxID=1378263 RepID=A0A9P8PHC0_9ASCO|nr:uncharacterized protein OGAPHI_000167 [Ogataea philodendri]KAH3671981.1 hypothetical protein OGAPHI_000167 [Ogataea philodendri]